jgi:hypothetical protein
VSRSLVLHKYVTANTGAWSSWDCFHREDNAGGLIEDAAGIDNITMIGRFSITIQKKCNTNDAACVRYLEGWVSGTKNGNLWSF